MLQLSRRAELEGFLRQMNKLPFKIKLPNLLGEACDKIRKVIHELGVSRTAKAIHNIELRQVEHEAELRAIQIALRRILTENERGTLTFLAKDEPFLCYYSDNLIDELRHLRAIGLIQNPPGIGFVDITREYRDRNQQFDLKRFCFITEPGRECLKLPEIRRAEVEPPMRQREPKSVSPTISQDRVTFSVFAPRAISQG